jgi:hypothetical protein
MVNITHCNGWKVVTLAGLCTPAGLAAAGSSLWRSVADAFDLDPAELALLEQACRTADELAALVDVLATVPVLVSGSTGQVQVHPLFAAVREHRRTLGRLLDEMALPDDDDVPRTGPRRAVDTRWRREARVGGRLAAIRDAASGEQ